MAKQKKTSETKASSKSKEEPREIMPASNMQQPVPGAEMPIGSMEEPGAEMPIGGMEEPEAELPGADMHEAGPEGEMRMMGMEEAAAEEEMPSGPVEEAGPTEGMPPGDMQEPAPPKGGEVDRPAGGEPPGRRSCGAMEIHRRLLSESEAYQEARSRIENLALEFEQGVRAAARTQVVRIPVVVHVVWNTAAENISDAQINSQIDVLDQDFRRLNPDVSNVPAAWQSLVEDPRVEFFLATQDPDGNPTTGILRRQTSVATFHTNNDDVKSNATGGADPWPADRYLNIWVCPRIIDSLGRTILGYAQFPGGPAATDGVVIAHSYFGTTGTATAPFNLGRTATHEIGHWLDLFHIWGDDGTGCTGTDNVADTPNQGGPNYGCPSFPHTSCGNAPNGDMFMNYMDYVDDRCMVMFTAGQVARIDAAFAGPRSSFLGGQVSVGRLEVFARGGNKALWHKWQVAPNDGWSGWASLGGWIDMIDVGQNADGRLEVFARGANKAVWHKWQVAPNDGWSGWASLGGWIDMLAVGRNADGRLEVFARGGDGALWHKWQVAPNDGWSGWASLGGWIDRLAVGRNADGRLEVFVRGSDKAVWHKWQVAPNDGWSGWASLGGWIDMIDVGQNADGRLEVFVRGSDKALWHKWQVAPNDGWSGWASLGGWIDMIDVGQNADGRLEVFVHGSDKAVWHKWQVAPNDGWSGWASLGGWIDMIDVGQNADGRLEVFARGANKAVWHKWQVAPNDGWSGWASLGGWIDRLAVANNAP